MSGALDADVNDVTPGSVPAALNCAGVIRLVPSARLKKAAVRTSGPTRPSPEEDDSVCSNSERRG